MRKQAMNPNRKLRRTLIALLGTTIAASWLFAAPALAGHKHKHKHKHHHRHHATLKRPVYYRGPNPLPPRVIHAPRRVVVPTVIRTRHIETYRPYYGGYVYYGPHRHDHDVYYFPVYRDHRYVYEPHFYCDGHRVKLNHVTFHGSNVSFRIAF